MDNNQLKKQLLHKPRKTGPDKTSWLSTGCTVLNLACSGLPHGGFFKGGYFLLVGDSASGKTFLALTCLAEAAHNPEFKNYRLIHDDIERGALMNMEQYFGNRMAKRLEAPAVKNGEPSYSSSVESLYYHIDDAFEVWKKTGKPFIYIVDSMDGLVAEDDEKKFQEQKKSHRKGTTTSGSFGTAKAKRNSEYLRKMLTPLRESGSILIIICQTRANLGFGFEPKTRGGGMALRFYASLELWSSVKERIKKTVKGKPVKIGTICKVDVKKNRVQGKDRSVNIPIYYASGFDDTGACVDYLIESGHWKGTAQNIKAPEVEFPGGSKEKLIRWIEHNSRISEVQQLVTKVWNEIEQVSQVPRKARYR